MGPNFGARASALAYIESSKQLCCSPTLGYTKQRPALLPPVRGKACFAAGNASLRGAYMGPVTRLSREIRAKMAK